MPQRRIRHDAAPAFEHTGSCLPAGTPAGLRTAVDAGAHSVYCGFRDETNARNFPGLNFDAEMREGIVYAHERGVKVLIALNTFMRAGAVDLWKRGVDGRGGRRRRRVDSRRYPLIAYARESYPKQRLHLSVQALPRRRGIAFYRDRFASRASSCRACLTVEEIARLTANGGAVRDRGLVFGGLCVMAEGRCMPVVLCHRQVANMTGVCSRRASGVTAKRTAR